MGQAREVFDRFTAEMNTTRDLKSMADFYADDAVLVTPDEGEIVGRERISEYHRTWLEPFPDIHVEVERKYETDNVAIDEGYTSGTHTGPLIVRPGKKVPGTGKATRLRTCDVVTVENGLITRHHLYYDQAEGFGQLGLLQELAT